jgi:hypothetical protein
MHACCFDWPLAQRDVSSIQSLASKAWTSIPCTNSSTWVRARTRKSVRHCLYESDGVLVCALDVEGLGCVSGFWGKGSGFSMSKGLRVL